MKKDEIINIFWTGGWDSTFRLLQLAQEPYTIQPIYIYDEKRTGNRQEQKAMAKILMLIQKNNSFKGKILPIIYHDKNNILTNYKNEAIATSYQNFKNKYKLGSQYEWFALLAKKLDIKIEVCVEYSERSKAHNTLLQEGTLSDIGNGRKIIDVKNSSSDLINVFEYAIFPTLQYSKVEMLRISKEKKWFKIMKETWFCHRPVNNRPCGNCNPCRDAMKEGMDFRMPLISKFRYYYYNASLKKILTTIFSIKKENTHKCICILGIKIKFKNKKTEGQ